MPAWNRLPHLITAKDLGWMLAPTVAPVDGIDEDFAREQIVQAFALGPFADEFYGALRSAIEKSVKRPQDLDGRFEKVAAAVPARRSRIKPLDASPAVSAWIVRLKVALDVAPDAMRNALETDKGRALVREGMDAVARHIVSALAR